MPEEMSKEIIKDYEKLAEENQQKLQEIEENKLPPIVSEKVQNKIAKTIRGILGGGMVVGAAASLSACKEPPAVVEEQEEKLAVEIPSETIQENKEETPPEATVEIEKVDAPDIKGETFNFILDQENKKYIDEETKEEVGVWVEDAVKIEGKMTSAIGLKPEVINKILFENKEKGIFKPPWPFDFQKNKGIEIVELFNNPLHKEKVFERMGAYLPDVVGIKYSEPIDFYAPFDASFKGSVTENIPDEKGPDFYSAQSFKNIAFGNKDLGGLQYNFIDWEPKVELSEAKIFGNDAYFQDILGDIKCGDFLGRILPNTADFNFLDFTNNKEFYENPGQFQGRLMITDSSDDFSEPKSSLEKMLKYKNKAGQEIPVCVWPERNTVHEQTN